MKKPHWILPEIIHAIHDEQLSAHGGSDGIRDLGLIESALTRPQNLYAYGKSVTIPQLAAAYCYGLAKNHGFVDGNKRVAAVACELFLNLNSYRLTADDAEMVGTILSVAEGSMTEEALARWVREHAERAK
jgi:death on curing protein